MLLEESVDAVSVVADVAIVCVHCRKDRCVGTSRKVCVSRCVRWCCCGVAVTVAHTVSTGKPVGEAIESVVAVVRAYENVKTI